MGDCFGTSLDERIVIIGEDAEGVHVIDQVCLERGWQMRVVLCELRHVFARSFFADPVLVGIPVKQRDVCDQVCLFPLVMLIDISAREK